MSADPNAPRRVALVADASSYVGPALATLLAERGHDLVLGDAPDDADHIRLETVGRFLDSSLDDLQTVVRGCVEAPYHFLRAVVPVMVAQQSGQVLVITSASAARPTPGAPLYSSARAAATMLARNVAAEVAATGVQVNAVGTNFMDFPEFRRATGADDPARRAKIEAQVPMGRLGTMEEFASFCMPYLDGTSRFTTGQFVAYAGGWA